MIREVVLPEKIGDYYLFSKRIIGFDIGKTHVSATSILLSARSIIIEQSFDEKLELGNINNYNERVSKAIASILKKCGRYDLICSSLSKTAFFIKEIKLPFVDYEQIKKIIGFEIESELPFAIDQAVIDFIVTKFGTTTEEGSQILVVAVSKDVISNHIAPFELISVIPKIINIDLFQLYNLYSQIPTYSSLEGGAAIIDFGFNSTGIAYIYNGQLRRIRTMAIGAMHIAKSVADSLKTTPQKATEMLIQFGLEQPSDANFTQSLQSSLQTIFSQIQFTINSSAQQIHAPIPLKQVLFLGGISQMKGFMNFASPLFGVPCSLFDLSDLKKNPKFKFKNDLQLKNENFISLATAVPQFFNENFNLNKSAQEKANVRLFNRQIFFALISVILIIFGLITHSFFVLRSLKREAYASEKEAMDLARETFKISEDVTTLEDVISKINTQISQEEKIWLMFSESMRHFFLFNLQELSKVIDRKAIALQLQKLSMDDTTLELSGSVHDMEAVNQLEEGLKQSKLFESVPDLQNPNFLAEPIIRLIFRRKTKA